MGSEPTPVLWVALSSYGEDSISGEEMDDMKNALQDAVGTEYTVVLADERIKLMDATTLREQLEAMVERLKDVEDDEDDG